MPLRTWRLRKVLSVIRSWYGVSTTPAVPPCAARPNAGHQAIVELEKHWGDRFTLVTQNVDGLHQAAGSRRVLELHGSIARVRCTGCAVAADRGSDALPDLPRCDACGELLRPGVVWFHEMLPEDVWRAAAEAVEACQCLLVAGTSAVVYPAAGLIDMARAWERAWSKSTWSRRRGAPA